MSWIGWTVVGFLFFGAMPIAVGMMLADSAKLSDDWDWEEWRSRR